MSNLDPVPKIDEAASPSEQGKPTTEAHKPEKVVTKLSTEEVNSQMKEWALVTLSPILIIVRVTIVIILAILADYLIIIVIGWSFGSIVNHNPFAAKLLEGIELLSALGTALAYILYLIRALFKDIQETEDVIKDMIKKDKEKST